MNQCDICEEWFDGDERICPACLEALAKEESLPFNMDYDEEDYEHPF